MIKSINFVEIFGAFIVMAAITMKAPKISTKLI